MATGPATTWVGFTLAVLSVVWGSFAAAQAAQETVTEQEIEEAIQTLKRDLYRMQDPRTGGWFGTHDETPEFVNPKYDGGPSVIATYALISAGDTPEVEPRLAKALEYVQSLQREHHNEVDGTYVVGIRAHIWPQLPREQYAASLERDAKRILAGASRTGTFSYELSKPPEPYQPDQPSGTRNSYDHSTTQYGVLGLWEAAKHGVRIPDAFWRAVAQHYVQTQFPDGGWSYNPDKEPTPSMTCAGLTVLCIAQQQLNRGDKKPDPALVESIERGLDYLDKAFGEGLQTYGGSGYFIYGVERVGLAAGRSQFGGQDWYDNLAAYIVKRVRRSSDSIHSNIHNSSFFLMFLSRGRVPVFINKLSLEAEGADQAWNNRPNDIYFLARHLSDTFEQELNWKVIPIDWKLDRWLGAPLTFLSIDAPFDVTEAQAQTIKRYLDLGGMLIVNPEGNTARILRSVDKLAGQMYPGAKLEPVAADHPVLTLWRAPSRPPRLLALSNGVRDLILMPQADWGFDWQRGGREAEDAYAIGGNLFLYTTGYRRLEGRASVRFPVDIQPDEINEKAPRIVVAVGGPGTTAEPGLWEYMRRTLGEAGTADLRVVAQPLDQLGQDVEIDGEPVAPDLVHLVGVGEDEALGDAIEALKRYADDGGTVLVETLGGRGGFASAVEAEFAAAFDSPSERLSSYEPLFSAGDLEGAADIERVTYRTYSVRNYGTDNKPRLVAFRVGDRPAVLVSGEDLSLAAMGVRHWGLHGYSAESSRELLTNILLHAEQ